MHFNGLIIQFRVQVLGGLAGLTTIGGFLIGQKFDTPRQRFGAVAIGGLVLAVTWAAAAVLDIFYYSRLLDGAVQAIRTLEKRNPDIQLSTTIEQSVNGPNAVWITGTHAVWFFYGIVFVFLLSLAVWATLRYRREVRPTQGQGTVSIRFWRLRQRVE